MNLTFVAPIKLISEANQREHWSAKLKRKKAQQFALQVYWRNNVKRKVALPCKVILTRVGACKLDPDNLAGSFKHVQDQIARELGCDDGSGLVEWVYRQQAVGVRHYQIQVDVVEVEV